MLEREGEELEEKANRDIKYLDTKYEDMNGDYWPDWDSAVHLAV
jgi:hypothetical protein